MHADHPIDQPAASPARPRGAMRRRLGWSVIGVAAAGALAAVLAPSPVASNADAALAFCATTPAEAQVAAAVAADHVYAARVPADNPANVLSTTTYAIARGEVIAFDVASTRPGQVAVHGLHDLEAVQVGGTITVRFRAVYTGRFPLHFHGVDGSHFELAALEILPASTASAGL